MKKEKNTHHFISRLISLITLMFLTLTVSFSQEINGSACEKHVPNAIKIKLNPNDNTIQYFKLRTDAKVKSIDEISYLLGILKLNKDINVKISSKETDKIGYTHSRYKFYYKSILIEDFTYIIHSKNDLIVSGNGEYSKASVFNNATPTIKSDDAIKIGKSKLKSESYFWKENEFPQPELTYILINNSYKLCYKTDIYSAKPLARKYFYIDAENGKVLKEINRIHHTDVIGTANTKYNGVRPITTNLQGSNYHLTETSRGNGINTYNLNNGTDYSNYSNFIDSDNNWTSTQNQDDAALDVHFGAEAFYDYYSSTFGRSSFDNSNGIINSFVHYDSNFVNAFWDGTNTSYGDGDGINFTALTSLEVIGHEMTHAVTQYSAGLEYQGESGALNESFSDIFGVIIDFYKNPSNANYLIGDQCNITGNGFRDMSNPKTHNNPDTYLGQFWVSDPNFDNGGVHSNSGVQNYWFYLLTNGGSGTNDINNNYIITAIPMDHAANIAYRTLTNYLTTSSNYNDARFFSIQAALDLYGECSIEVISVTNAWYAVGIGSSYSGDVVANFSANKIVSCSSPSTIQFYNFSKNASSYQWDFGDGNSSTIENPIHTYIGTGNYTIKLISLGNGFCNTSDTIILNDFISINNGNPTPIDAICSPSTTLPSNSNGITSITFNTISNTSDFSLNESYQDFTCTKQTTLIAGTTYTLNFKTGLEYGKAWIDYNNNGDFETNELIYHSQIKLYEHMANIIIQGTSYYSTPLRMRVLSNETILNNACSNPSLGQFEDYTIIITPNNNPPIANFEAETTVIAQNSTLGFFDLSLNVPTSWNWYFEGATIQSSNLQNPVVSYPNQGTYLVKLIVTNNYGNDSITKSYYINVVSSYQMCLNQSSSSINGRLIDSGSDTANYQDQENCTFTVQPINPIPLLINIVNFDTEYSYDFLKIYDGLDNVSSNITILSGNQNSTSYVSNTGFIYFEWTSDQNINSSGFEITWSPYNSYVGGIIHNGNLFTYSPITFNSIETNTSNYFWDFGDGNTVIGNFQETHSYQYPGNYIIQLNYYDSNNQLKTYYHYITIQSSNSLNELNSSNLSIYPNPTNDIINIKNNSEFNINSITLKNSIGQRINSINPINKGEKNTINLSEFSTGIYYIEVLFENGEQSIQKVVKSN